MKNELTIRKECRARVSDLSQTADPSMQRSKTNDSLNWCNLNEPELARIYQSKTDEYWRTYKLWFGAPPEGTQEREIDDQIMEGRVAQVGRYAFLATESAAAAVLATIYFNALPWIAMLIGCLLAYTMGMAATALVTRWIRDNATDQPRKQEKRLTLGMCVLGLPWVLAFVTALATLRSQWSGGGFLFFAATTVVTLLSPLCIGLCGYAADLLLWSERLCADIRLVRLIATELQYLRQKCQQVAPAGPAQNSKSPPTPRSIPNSATAVLTLVVVLFLVPVISHGQDLSVRVYTDVSPSARATDVIRALDSISHELSEYRGEATLNVSLIPFFEDAFNAAPIVQITIPGHVQVQCPPTKEPNELARLSKVYAEADQREAVQRCEEVRARRSKEAANNRMLEIKKFEAGIYSLASSKLPGHCTAVNAIIRRAAHETPNGISIVVSDMENTCGADQLTYKTLENRVFVVPVGSHTEPIEQKFDDIQSRFAQMQAIQVVESYRLKLVFDSITHPDAQLAAGR